MEAAVGQHHAQVDGEAHARQLRARPPAEGAAQVAAEQAQGRVRPPLPPGVLQHGPGLGVGPHHAPAPPAPAPAPRTATPWRSARPLPRTRELVTLRSS